MARSIATCLCFNLAIKSIKYFMITKQNKQNCANSTPNFSFYENFNGQYHKIDEIADLIPKFKMFYYAEKEKDLSRSAIKIINDFNAQIAPLTFFPWERQYRLWRKKWDAELLALKGYQEQQKGICQIVRIKDGRNAMIVPTEKSLEYGADTLAGELINDAMSILKSDQDNEELYKDEIIVKRRNYVLNVFNHVTKSVHGKEALRLKSNTGRRETMGFLMNLMNLATAGKISNNDLAILKNSTNTNNTHS
jgi:hypothetical protein